MSEVRTVRRTSAWVSACILFLALCWLQGRTGRIGAAPLKMALLHVASLALLWPMVKLFPSRCPALPALLVLALAARALWFPFEPGDDIYRYIWEGRIQHEALNPYVVAPDDPVTEPFRDAQWQQINHPDLPAIYPPGVQLLFRGISRLTVSPLGFKLALSAFDLLTIVLLAKLLRLKGRKPEWVLLYALNPVVLLSFAGEAHLDVLLVCAVAAALYAASARRGRLMFLALGLAVQVKYVALAYLPLLLRRWNLRHAWIVGIPLLVPFLFFSPLADVFRTLMTFSTEMQYNSSIHRLLALATGSSATASVACGLLFLALVAGLSVAATDPLEAGLYATGGLLLLMPTVHTWYLTWLTPFLCFRPWRPGLLFCATIVFSFSAQAHMERTGAWGEPAWATLCLYAPVYLALLTGIIRPRPFRVADAAEPAPVSSVSILVPTLNEEQALGHLLSDAKRCNGPPVQVIICDGGSTDATARVARAAGAVLVQSQPGRGTQVAAGVSQATGDVLLVAHADMRLDPDVPGRILDALNHCDAPGGCVGCRFTPPTPFLRVVSALNYLRARVFGMSFGDQGQFVRRDALSRLGGFPDLPIMEDVELSFRLREVGRPLYLGGGIAVSSRRWTSRSPARHAVLVVRIVTRYTLARLRGRSPALVDTLYRRYYHSNR